MTKEEFEKSWCERSGISLEKYHETFLTRPCYCNFEECDGWAVVFNNERDIAHHDKFNGKEDRQ